MDIDCSSPAHFSVRAKCSQRPPDHLLLTGTQKRGEWIKKRNRAHKTITSITKYKLSSLSAPTAGDNFKDIAKG